VFFLWISYYCFQLDVSSFLSYLNASRINSGSMHDSLKSSVHLLGLSQSRSIQLYQYQNSPKILPFFQSLLSCEMLTIDKSMVLSINFVTLTLSFHNPLPLYITLWFAEPFTPIPAFGWTLDFFHEKFIFFKIIV
jgi:hypothetical protein